MAAIVAKYTVEYRNETDDGVFVVFRPQSGPGAGPWSDGKVMDSGMNLLITTEVDAANDFSVGKEFIINIAPVGP